MPEYYLDIETFAQGSKPNPFIDKVITIQFQRLSTLDGTPEGDLNILTEWGCGSEKAMLDTFKPTFLTEKPFDFIPIGVNLHGYDLIVLIQRLNFHCNLSLGMSLLRDKPTIDLKPTLVMINNGRFTGYSSLLGKKESGAQVKDWYTAKDYERILRYIREEANQFIRVYQVLKKSLPLVNLQAGTGVSPQASDQTAKVD